MKNTQRNGKIARLPLVVREELNQRIDDGELGDGILQWLNEVPVVKEIVAKEWEGKVISEQNLSAWRNGGYREWVEQRQVMELAVRLAENAGELRGKIQDAGGRMQDGESGMTALGETMAVWVAARLMVMTRRWEEVEDEEEKWKLLRGMSVEVARFRRGEAQADRVRNEREWLEMEKRRLEWEREKKRKVTEEEMMAWAMREENRARIAEGFVSRAEKITLIRRAYFADVNHPVNGAEVAVALAMTEMQPTDSGFGRKVAELFVQGLLREDEVAALDDFAKEMVARGEGGQNIQHRTSNTQHPMGEALRGVAGGGEPPGREGAKGEMVGDQGGSSLIKVEGAEGAPRRHEDTKGGEDVEAGGSAGRPACGLELQTASGVRVEAPESEVVKADQGGSRLVKVEEGEGSTQRLKDSKGGEGAGSTDGDTGCPAGGTEQRAEAGVSDGVPEHGSVKADQGGSSLIKAKDGAVKWWSGLQMGAAGMGNGAARLRRPPWR